MLLGVAVAAQGDAIGIDGSCQVSRSLLSLGPDANDVVIGRMATVANVDIIAVGGYFAAGTNTQGNVAVTNGAYELFENTSGNENTENDYLPFPFKTSIKAICPLPGRERFPRTEGSYGVPGLIF